MEEVEKLKKENEELKKQIEMIKTFYEENSFIKRIKFYKEFLKEKRKNANNRNDTKNDTTRDSTIFNSSNVNTWNDEIDKLFNGEKIERK